MEEYTQLSFDFMTDFEDTGKFVGKVGIFKTKKCTKCNVEYEANNENFNKHPATKDKLSSWCRECTVKGSLTGRRKKIKEGIYCASCKKLKLPNSMFCSYHHIQKIIHSQKNMGRFKHLKTKNEITLYVEKLIEKLENQNYKCAITGVTIELGVNASLDHIQEFSQGGTCTLENLQWVDKTANLSKPRKYKND